ncbi:unnamed protein product, partial [Didymodactylos carnosus]
MWFDFCIDDTAVTTRERIEELCHIVCTLLTFTNSDECVEHIKQMKGKKIFLIINDTRSTTILQQTHWLPQLKSIYIFCSNKEEQEQLSKDYKKVRVIDTQMESIYPLLKQDMIIAQEEDSFLKINIFPSSASTTANELLGGDVKNKQESSFMYFQLLREILLEIDETGENARKEMNKTGKNARKEMKKTGKNARKEMNKTSENARKEMIEYYRQTFDGDDDKLKFLDDFETEYRPDQAVTWYTRQSFLYRTLNHALRELNVEDLYKLRFFIKDLHHQLLELYLEESKNSLNKIDFLYRGTGMYNKDFHDLQKNCGGLLSFNNFLSTSTEEDVALVFAKDSLEKKDMTAVLFEIEIDPSIPTCPFADISKVSEFADESEVLFSMGAVFRIVTISLTDGVYKVKMKLTGDEDKQLKTLTEYIKKYSIGDGKYGLISLGKLMYQMGDYDKAEDFFRLLLEDKSLVNNDVRRLSVIYNDLGAIYQEKGDYENSSVYHRKCLEIKEHHKPLKLEIPSTLSNIG